jgi:hypothetical protein
VNVPLGTLGLVAVQRICVKGMVSAPLLKGIDESAVKTFLALPGVEVARRGTGYGPEDEPATAPEPGSWTTVKRTLSMVPPLVPTRRLS